MGFPIGYTEVVIPRVVLWALSFLGLIRQIILFILTLLGLSDFLEPELVWPDQSSSSQHPARPDPSSSASASLIREILPAVVKFSDLDADQLLMTGSCAVCLYDFEGEEEVRRLWNCRHVFHRCCLDRWIDCDRRNCPLCRATFVPDELQDDFNDRLWAPSDFDDSNFSDFALIDSF